MNLEELKQRVEKNTAGCERKQSAAAGTCTAADDGRRSTK